PIRIPDWDDVIHLAPRSSLTSADKRHWTAWMDETGTRSMPVEQLRQKVADTFASGGDVAGLTPAQVDTALRGRQIYQDMQMSAVPQWRQAMIRVLTTLDNVEDDVSTVEWITRPLTRRWAPTRALSEATRRFTGVVSDIEKVLAGPTLSKALMKRKAANTRRRSARGERETLAHRPRGPLDQRQ